MTGNFTKGVRANMPPVVTVLARSACALVLMAAGAGMALAKDCGGFIECDCGDRVVADEDLEIPDPEIRERPFLAIPLAELAPTMVLPGSEETMREIAACFANHHMKQMLDYTQSVKEEIET